MKHFIEWLLGLDQIRLGPGAPLTLRFDTTPAPWIMLFGAIVAGYFAYRTYRRVRVASRWRYMLMPLRFGVIMTALFVLGRPILVLQKNEIEPSVVAVLLDDSASMASVDVSAPLQDRDSAVPRSRWSQSVQSVLAEGDGLIDRLRLRHEVEFWTFDATASHVARIASEKDVAAVRLRAAASEPAGRLTNVARSLTQVFDSMQGRRLAGVVVVTDGRQTALSGVELAMQASGARRAPIHTVTVGSAVPRKDVDLVRVHAPEHVYVTDAVGIDLRLEIKGFDAELPLAVEIEERSTGETVGRQTLEIDRGQSVCRGRIVYRPTSPGLKKLVARVLPQAGEENVANNAADFSLTAHDARVSVLFVDDQPRYEYRFLKNVLLREATIESSCLLLSATPGFSQEGTRPVTMFPRSIEELGRYDVIIFGDVDVHGDWLTPAQEAMIVDFVSASGGGLAFVAGERNMPESLRRTRLEKLLPVRLPPARGVDADEIITDAWQPRLTTAGRDNVIFSMAEADVSPGDLLKALPGWYWHARISGPQPGAIVLASHAGDEAAQDDTPVAVLGRFGKGRTFFLGSDDLWRWRQFEGESYYTHVWVQIIRTLARARKFGERGLRLETDRRRYELGREVKIELFDDADAGDSLPSNPAVLVKDDHDQPLARVPLRRESRGSVRAVGEFAPPRAGQLTLTLENAPREAAAPARVISVVHTDRETDRKEADPEFLKTLATGSGGVAIQLGDDWRPLVDAIPDRSVQIPADVEEPVWDTRLMLFLFTGLIASEWIIRKGIGLV